MVKYVVLVLLVNSLQAMETGKQNNPFVIVEQIEKQCCEAGACNDAKGECCCIQEFRRNAWYFLKKLEQSKITSDTKKSG